MLPPHDSLRDGGSWAPGPGPRPAPPSDARAKSCALASIPRSAWSHAAKLVKIDPFTGAW